MKTRHFVTTCLLLAGMVAGSMAACSKSNENDAAKRDLIAQANGGDTQECCSVTCSKGYCHATGFPCDCTCSFLGKARCHGSRGEVAQMSDDEFTGDALVKLDSDFLPWNKSLREKLYELNSVNTIAIADKLAMFDTLIATYGYELKTKSALLDYYEILDFEDSVANFLTTSEQLQLVDFM